MHSMIKASYSFRLSTQFSETEVLSAAGSGPLDFSARKPLDTAVLLSPLALENNTAIITEMHKELMEYVLCMWEDSQEVKQQNPSFRLCSCFSSSGGISRNRITRLSSNSVYIFRAAILFHSSDCAILQTSCSTQGPLSSFSLELVGSKGFWK